MTGATIGVFRVVLPHALSAGRAIASGGQIATLASDHVIHGNGEMAGTSLAIYNETARRHVGLIVVLGRGSGPLSNGLESHFLAPMRIVGPTITLANGLALGHAVPTAPTVCLAPVLATLLITRPKHVKRAPIS